ncbi:hypothetical protein [Candidatus Mycolicibacterium alkanivorans]|nr:hypothetical protein [Candidatus Mycolicibacterium alkanivorans]
MTFLLGMRKDLDAIADDAEREERVRQTTAATTAVRRHLVV